VFPFVLQNHHNGFKLKKENIKRKVDLGDYQNSLIELENNISELESSYSYTFPNKKEKYGEHINLKHIEAHLNSVINENDPAYFDSETGTIKHQSDKVKSSLLYIPKSDYSEA
jgi:hypothetical protein